jgi:hypothetical protein
MYFMKLGSLLRGKLLAFALVSVAVVGGATAVFAATPTGQSVVHTITGSAHATATREADNQDNNSSDNGSHANNGNKNNCPGLPDAQRLATQFSLSTGSNSDDIQAICSLHQGSFKGATPNGTSVTSSRVFGYGEIDMLLTYAQFLATQDKTNASGKLTTDNARSYLAEAIQSCGATPLNTCLKTNIPNFQPGDGHNNDNGNGNHDNNGDGNSGGMPTSTPTPHH